MKETHISRTEFRKARLSNAPTSVKKPSLTVSAATLLGIISFPSMITVAHAEEVPDNQTIELNQQSEETSAAEETEGQKEAVVVEKTETDALKKERSSVSVELEEAETS